MHIGLNVLPPPWPSSPVSFSTPTATGPRWARWQRCSCTTWAHTRAQTSLLILTDFLHPRNTWNEGEIGPPSGKRPTQYAARLFSNTQVTACVCAEETTCVPCQFAYREAKHRHMPPSSTDYMGMWHKNKRLSLPWWRNIKLPCLGGARRRRGSVAPSQ